MESTTMIELPGLVLLQDYGGDVNFYLEQVYNIYKNTIVNANLTLFSKVITCQWHPPCKNKHANFWHIISTSDATLLEENIDFNRCAKIPWIAEIIKNSHDENIIWCWNNERSGKRGKLINTLLYLHAN